MYGKVKMSKRQIKEDKFTAFMLTTKNQVMDNWQFYAVGVVIVILLFVAVSYFMDSQKAKAAEANDMYSQAIMQYQSGNAQIAIVTLNQLIDDHAGEIAAEKATYFLGSVNLNSNNYPEAIRYFQMYVDNYKSDKLLTAASYAGIATASENQGLYDQAIVNFEKAIAANENGPLAADYSLALVRNALAAGDYTKAEQVVDIIREKYPQTATESKAIEFLAEKTPAQ